MLGTWVNTAAILAGGLLGLLLRGGISERLRETVMQGLGLCVFLIGLQGALATEDIMAVIVCIVAGGLLGETLGLEARLEALGARAERLFSPGKAGPNTFAQGFVTTTLLFCVGAMAIVGALDGGLRNDHGTLFAKSALDGVSAIFFASALGPGVLLSALSILLYQGSIALAAQFLSPLLSGAIIREMSAIGGLLILGVALNMLKIAKIRVGNLLPAIFLPIVYYLIVR